MPKRTGIHTPVRNWLKRLAHLEAENRRFFLILWQDLNIFDKTLNKGRGICL